MPVQPATFIQYDPAIESVPVPSPCTGVCRMNASTRLCDGCHRDIGEILQWGTASDADKRQIWCLIQQRRLALSDG